MKIKWHWYFYPKLIPYTYTTFSVYGRIKHEMIKAVYTYSGQATCKVNTIGLFYQILIDSSIIARYHWKVAKPWLEHFFNHYWSITFSRQATFITLSWTEMWHNSLWNTNDADSWKEAANMPNKVETSVALKTLSLRVQRICLD